MNQSLNILLICKSLPGTFKGGIQSHVWDLSESLISPRPQSEHIISRKHDQVHLHRNCGRKGDHLP